MKFLRWTLYPTGRKTDEPLQPFRKTLLNAATDPPNDDVEFFDEVEASDIADTIHAPDDTVVQPTVIEVPQEALDDTRKYIIGVGLVATAALIWSFGHLTFRMISITDPWQMMGYRWFLVLPFMLGMIMASHGRKTDKAIIGGGWPVVVTGLLLAGSSIFYVLAISYTTIANVLFMIAAAPMFAALLARIILGESVRLATLLSFPFVLLGMGIMIGDSIGGGSLAGNLIGLASSLCYAAFSVTIRLRPEADTRTSAIYASLLVCACGLILMGMDPIPLTDLFWLMLGGVWQLGLGYMIFTMGAKYVPAVQLLLLGMLETVCAPLWLWLFFGEVPRDLVLVGGGIVLATVAVQAMMGARRKPLGMLRPR